jgi:hypothetical protein
MRKTFIAGAVIAAVAAVVAAVASAGPQGGKTIVFIQRDSDYAMVHFVDQAPKSPTGQPDHITPGDEILQMVKLRDTKGNVIGRRYDELTFLTPSTNAASIDLVHTVFVFGDGTVYTQGLHGPNLSAPDAVIGGTGAYAGAHGTLTEVEAKKGNYSTETVRLMP